MSERTEFDRQSPGPSEPLDREPRGLLFRFGIGIGFSLLSVAATGGTTFAVNLIVARLLGRNAFGEFAVLQGAFATVSLVAQMGIGLTATKFIAEFSESNPVRALRVMRFCSASSLITGAMAAVIVVGVAPWAARRILGAPHLWIGLAVSGIAAALAVRLGFQNGALAGLQCYRTLAFVNILGGLSSIALCSAGTALGGVTGAIVGVALGVAIQIALSATFLSREKKRRGLLSSAGSTWAEKSLLWSFMVPAAVGGATNMPVLWYAMTLLARGEHGFSDVALFGAANSLRTLMSFVPAIVNTVGFSFLNKAKGRGEDKEYRRLFRWNVAATVATSTSVAAVVIFLAPILLGWFGRDFGAARPVVWVLAAAVIAEGLGTSFYQLIQTHGRMWLSLLGVSLPRDGALLFLAIKWIPEHGAMGLAAAMAVAWAISALSTAVSAAIVSKAVRKKTSPL